MNPSTPQAYQSKITQLTGMTPQAARGVFGGNLATRTFREKKQQQRRVFLDQVLAVIFDVCIHMDNIENSRAIDLKFVTEKHENFIATVRT